MPPDVRGPGCKWSRMCVVLVEAPDFSPANNALFLDFVILSGASAPLLFRGVCCGGRTRSRRICGLRELLKKLRTRRV